MLHELAVPICDAAPAPVPATASFPGSTAAEWEALTLSGLDPHGNFAPSLGCFLVRWGGRLVLCDLGIGPGPNAYLGGLRGDLPAQLARNGVSAAEIDAVIFTHLHMDHVGWAISIGADGKPAAMFPNADYFVAEPELMFWTAGANGAKAHHVEAFDAQIRPLIGLGRLFPVGHGETILPGIRLMATPGHTPGHASILFDADGETLAIAGDIFHCPGQVERPDFGHRADMDADRARVTRQGFIARAAAEDWTIACGHFREGQQLGKIVAHSEGFRFVPDRFDHLVVPVQEPIQQGRLQ